ncbi:MAG: hypothetical protein HYY93_05225 [Planctomycetes bacterium]|nr:hypothetical protein [Planctomycetota bacterium]
MRSPDDEMTSGDFANLGLIGVILALIIATVSKISPPVPPAPPPRAVPVPWSPR